jgi:hypothetical protein
MLGVRGACRYLLSRIFGVGCEGSRSAPKGVRLLRSPEKVRGRQQARHKAEGLAAMTGFERIVPSSRYLRIPAKFSIALPCGNKLSFF